MLYPLKFHPVLRTMVWGGDRIAAYKGIETDQPSIGESWEVSAYPGMESVVAEGALAGRTLSSLVEEYRGKLVGEPVYARCGDEFPLLVKFIDARADLSIQVHPDDAMARRVHGEQNGKTEMWYVMDSAPDAHLYSGITRPFTPEEYERLIAEDRIVDVLADHPVKEGDVFFLPAGRIHAICAGTFLAEIQQTSDLTYRIYDYNRPGLDGKPRPLHTDKAKEAIDYKVYPSYKTAYEPVLDARTPLVSCPYFTTDLYRLTRPLRIPLGTLDSFFIVMCLEGTGMLEDGEPLFGGDGLPTATRGHRTTLRPGETVLIPATSRGIVLTPEGGNMKLLTTHC